MSQPRAAIGFGLVLTGVIFLLDAVAVLDLWAASTGWWPLLLVVVGVVLLLVRSAQPRVRKRRFSLALLSARIEEVRERPFRSGRTTSVLGHAELDFRSAGIDDEGATLTVVVVLGSAWVTVPPGWAVRIQPRIAVANVVRETLPVAADAPVLTIRGFAMLSDLHVRTGSVVG